MFRTIFLAALFLSLSSTAFADKKYQLGDEWGKVAVDVRALPREMTPFKRAALATAKVASATGFYLGNIGGRHLMATNHHVFPRAGGCMTQSIYFPLQQIKPRCVEIFASWPEIDLAIFEISLTKDDAEALTPAGKNFSYEAQLFPGQQLLTIGFGRGDNPGLEMMANQDSDCRVFSQRGEYRLMADPDTLNPGLYSAWSFANGCDVSHGDSGSAMVDRESGDVIGIIWTGKVPKHPKVQSSDYLATLQNSHSEEVWQELSYGVPTEKMGEFFEKQLMRVDVTPKLKSVIRDLLNTRN